MNARRKGTRNDAIRNFPAPATEKRSVSINGRFDCRHQQEILTIHSFRP
jgi:hypothetical protein